MIEKIQNFSPTLSFTFSCYGFDLFIAYLLKFTLFLVWDSFLNIIRINICSLYRRVVLPIYWVDSTHILSFGLSLHQSLELMVEINTIMHQHQNCNYHQQHQIQLYIKTTIDRKTPSQKTVSNTDTEEDIQNCQISYTTIVVLLILNYIWLKLLCIS